MPLYEHVFLARQDVSQQQVDALTNEYKQIITDAGGNIGRSEYWGLKSLAYKIKKNRKAHYTLVNVEAPHEAVAEMERQMSLSSDVLRFMTLRVKTHDDKPSAMMKRSDERGDRGDRRGPRRDREGGGPRGDRGEGGPRGDRPDRSDRAPRPEAASEGDAA